MSEKPKPFPFRNDKNLTEKLNHDPILRLHYILEVEQWRSESVVWLQEEKAKEICRGCWGFGNNKCVVSCKARDLLIDLRRKVLEVM